MRYAKYPIITGSQFSLGLHFWLLSSFANDDRKALGQLIDKIEEQAK
jgi:hypothetical protein